MNISEQMKRKTAGLPPPCMETSTMSPTLSVYFSDDEARAFAWSRFDSACLRGERITLVFGEHEVVAHGQNLSRVMEKVAEFHIECLRTIPAIYRPVDSSELVIREIEVRKVQV